MKRLRILRITALLMLVLLLCGCLAAAGEEPAMPPEAAVVTAEEAAPAPAEPEPEAPELPVETPAEAPETPAAEPAAAESEPADSQEVPAASEAAEPEAPEIPAEPSEAEPAATESAPAESREVPAASEAAEPEAPVEPEVPAEPAAAEPETPDAGLPEEASTASNPEYMIVVVGDSDAEPDPSSGAGRGSVTFEMNDGLTVIVKGVNDDNRDQLQALIDENSWQTLNSGNVLEIHMPTLLDAEKYSTVGGPYDKDLCWAAAASNLLWASGYAQEAVNPATGAAFLNEDEVFDYFRRTFTDNGGLEDGAVSVFMTGDYAYDGEWYVENDWSQLKEGDAEGLLPETDPQSVSEYIPMQDSPESIEVLEGLDSVSAALSLRQIKDDSVSAGAWKWDEAYGHAVTAVGLVYDALVNDVKDRYKAILLADSDNTPVNGSSSASDDAKAAAAASAPNTYSMYGLTLTDFGDQYGPLWVIDNYPGTLANGLAHVAILDIFVLRDKASAQPEDPETPAAPEKQPAAKPSAPGRDMYTRIKRMMTENGWLIYSPAGWRHPAGRGAGFEIYFHASLTFLEEIALDGEPLTYRDYNTKNCRNGLFILTIRGTRMKPLEKGTHTLTVKLKNCEEITMQISAE